MTYQKYIYTQIDIDGTHEDFTLVVGSITVMCTDFFCTGMHIKRRGKGSHNKKSYIIADSVWEVLKVDTYMCNTLL